jgi:CheY-like chemotaxis protein
MQARANDKGLTSGVDIGANCPRFVIGDQARVRQVLMSLIDAALKSTEEGSVRLHASANEIDGRLKLRFDVTDTGRGLSKAEQERLFHPDFRIEGINGKQSGSLLGLSIARRLAEAMGGEVGCDSAVGQGSLYWFTLPAERARAAALDATQLSESHPHGTLSGHVLVVEDNAVNRMLIAAYLDEFGLSYEMVDSSGAALLALAAKTYDLVLMDTTMPDLDGIETAKRIRGLHAPAATVPIVALVAQAMKSYCGNYLSAGMDTYVLKPIRGRELFAALAPFLSPETKPTLRVVRG